MDLQTLIEHETSKIDFGVFTRPFWCTLIALARPKILQCVLSPPPRNGRPKLFLVAIQVVSASRLGGLNFHGVACAPTAPTQEYCKRGAGTRFAATRSMSQHVVSVTLNRAVAADTWLFQPLVGLFLSRWISCSGFVVPEAKRSLRLRQKERERAGRITNRGRRSNSESVG